MTVLTYSTRVQYRYSNLLTDFILLEYSNQYCPSTFISVPTTANCPYIQQ